MAAGSNGMVAWGFTNSYGDFSDARCGKCVSPDFVMRRERIAVSGAGKPSRWSSAMWVPGSCSTARSMPVRRQQRVPAGRVARDAPGSHEFRTARPSSCARTLDEVLALAPKVGIPGQNLVVGDAGGRIAWTLLGRVPRGEGPDRLFGALEFRDAMDHPRLADPPVGRLWTANQRVVDGPLEAVVGDDEAGVGAGGYDIGARARQIRDDLLGLTHPASEADMLAIQLDARALFLARWRDLLLSLLDGEAMGADLRRREFRELVSGWKPEATPDSVGYRLVRAFRRETLETLWRGLTTSLAGEDFSAGARVNSRPRAGD